MMQSATLGGGCFWCLEAVFEQVRGVEKCVSGYCNGTIENPTYEQVCTGRTGHAEVVQLTFDESQITFNDLLDIFFSIHDPTTLNRQGADTGTQYRSGIFHHDDQQRELAIAKIQELEKVRLFPGKIVTEITPLAKFYPAEAYHQSYFQLHGQQPYCQAVISPKLAKFRKVLSRFAK
jgi:peptide-methionine (S)-S-oxide reductase